MFPNSIKYGSNDESNSGRTRQREREAESERESGREKERRVLVFYALQPHGIPGGHLVWVYYLVSEYWWAPLSVAAVHIPRPLLNSSTHLYSHVRTLLRVRTCIGNGTDWSLHGLSHTHTHTVVRYTEEVKGPAFSRCSLFPFQHWSFLKRNEAFRHIINVHCANAVSNSLQWKPKVHLTASH